MIYKNLTAPVFILGLGYSLSNLPIYFNYFAMSKSGITLLWYTLQAWLGPILFIFIYSLVLFWLGILDGGDGQFLVAITPWLGTQKMIAIILLFYPIGIVYLVLYLLYKNNFDVKKVMFQQFRDFTTMFKMIPRILTNIKNGEEHVLVKNIPYESKTMIPPAGMVPISISILISLLS